MAGMNNPIVKRQRDCHRDLFRLFRADAIRARLRLGSALKREPPADTFRPLSSRSITTDVCFDRA